MVMHIFWKFATLCDPAYAAPLFAHRLVSNWAKMTSNAHQVEVPVAMD